MMPAPWRAKRVIVRVRRRGLRGHVLDVDGLDLVAERFLDGQAPLIVLVGPAVVADRSDVDESDLQLVGAGGGTDGQRQRETGHDCEQLPHGFILLVGGWSSDPLQRSGTKGWPMQAGVFIFVKMRLPEISTRAAIVTT